MYNKKSIKDLNKKDLEGKKVLIRVDFNVPVDKETGKITDDTRIVATLPTLNYLLDHQAKIIIMTHFGRPDGEKKPKYKLDNIAKRFSELIGKPVLKLDDCIGSEVSAKVNSLKNGEIIILENVRFYKEEEANDKEFAKKLAALGDLYVNDAFGTAHRAHASTEGVAHFLPAYAGLLIKKELDIMGKALTNPERPFVAIIGGAKVSSKIAVLENLLNKVDRMIIGGGMAYTFLKAKGLSIGNSLIEENMIPTAQKILQIAYEKKLYIYLPIDHIVTKEFAADAESSHVARGNIDEGQMGMDIGPLTIDKFSGALKGAKTVFWNGPMGVFEFDKFAKGTIAIAGALAKLPNATTIIGGGDSASAVEKAGFAAKMTHISTGGGASLEFIEGKELPGIAALLNKEEVKVK